MMAALVSNSNWRKRDKQAAEEGRKTGDTLDSAMAVSIIKPASSRIFSRIPKKMKHCFLLLIKQIFIYLYYWPSMMSTLSAACWHSSSLQFVFLWSKSTSMYVSKLEHTRKYKYLFILLTIHDVNSVGSLLVFLFLAVCISLI